MKLLTAVLFSLPLLAQDAATQQAQAPDAPPKFSIDVGNRWVLNLDGSKDAYRSIVNLGEGPKVFGLDLSLNGAYKLFDKLSVRANSWGGEPYSTAQADVRLDRAYRLWVDYRNIAYVNALPSFADPGISRGVFLDHQSYNVRRRMFDTQLDLFPGRRIVPYLAYGRDWGLGTGVSDFVVEDNEYPVADTLYDTTDNYRGGVRLEFSRFSATLEQGGTVFKDDERLHQTTGVNLGDRTTPILGQRLSLATLNQAYRIRGNSVYTKALFTADPFSWVDLYGQYLYSRPTSDTTLNQSNTGEFFSQDTLAFFTAEQARYVTEAKQPHTAGSFGAELRPHRRLRVFESIVTDRLTTTATLLALMETSTPGPASAQGDNTALQPLKVNYNRQEFNVLFDVTPRLTLRGGHRYAWGDAEVRAPVLGQTGPEQTGRSNMNVGLAGLTFLPANKIRFYFDFEASSAGRSYFRTSLADYQRMQIRAKYQPLASLSLAANFSWLNNENPFTSPHYQFESRNNSLTAYWTPKGGRWIGILADYTRSTVNSDATYLVPQTLQTARSVYVERAHTGTAALDLTFPKLHQQSPKLTVGGSLFVSSGSRPTQFYQPLGRFSFPVCRRASLFADWRWYNLGERFYVFEGFRSNQFILGLHLGM